MRKLIFMSNKVMIDELYYILTVIIFRITVLEERSLSLLLSPFLRIAVLLVIIPNDETAIGCSRETTILYLFLWNFWIRYARLCS